MPFFHVTLYLYKIKCLAFYLFSLICCSFVVYFFSFLPFGRPFYLIPSQGGGHCPLQVSWGGKQSYSTGSIHSTSNSIHFRSEKSKTHMTSNGARHSNCRCAHCCDKIHSIISIMTPVVSVYERQRGTDSAYCLLGKALQPCPGTTRRSKRQRQTYKALDYYWSNERLACDRQSSVQTVPANQHARCNLTSLSVQELHVLSRVADG